MKKIDLRKGWNFYESKEGTAYSFGEPDTVKVDLPHDYIIYKKRIPGVTGNEHNAYFPEGQGIYERHIKIPADWMGKTLLLDIDGAFMNTEVLINDELVILHPNGYIPFQVDLTPYILYGDDNFLRIFTQSRYFTSRWYNGGGLYRTVTLWVGNEIYVNPWDVFVSTPEVTDQYATVKVGYILNGNIQKKEVEVQFEIINQEGRGIAQGRQRNSSSGEIQVIVKNPVLWDLDNPYLYTYRLTVLVDHTVTDETEDHFGIRLIEVDAVNGFRLNGKSIKLKGGCMHHDNGFLGACAYPKAEERKIKKMLSAGYNTVRISHYPPSLEMLRICDRLGMLVMDEAFDVWTRSKVPMDYHLYFSAWWEQDIEWMVKRDRNHPCIITYSIGNEIKESNGSSRQAEWSARLTSKIKEYDKTRPVLCALCGIFPIRKDGDEPKKKTIGNLEANTEKIYAGWEEATEEFCKPLDIVGCNYLHHIYERIHEKYPNRVLLATETHSFTTYDYWKKAEELPYVIGDCMWVAFDYLGEVGVGKVFWSRDKEDINFAGPYPWRTSWQADFDLTGEERPQSVYRQIMWGREDKSGIFVTHPRHYGDTFYSLGWHWYDVNDNWTFEEEYIGKMVKVDVYGAGDEAEFILNGKCLGRSDFNKLIATMDIIYEPGILEAIVYKEGKELSRSRLQTTNTAQELCVISEDKIVQADGLDLGYIRVELKDLAGRRLMYEERIITVEISGCGEFLAMGGGNPCIDDSIGTNNCHLYRGTAIIIVKSTIPGEMQIKVNTEDGIVGYGKVTFI